MNNLKRNNNNIFDLTELSKSLKLIKLEDDINILDSKKNDNLLEENNKLNLKLQKLEFKIIELENEVIELKSIIKSPTNKEFTYIS